MGSLTASIVHPRDVLKSAKNYEKNLTGNE
ncbi:hypothetical protein [Peribacillus huizhouensis]|nr:hypothetical protein [Peribacillus huizhouensis]